MFIDEYLNINIIYNAIICWLKKIINTHLLLQLTNINNEN